MRARTKVATSTRDNPSARMHRPSKQPRAAPEVIDLSVDDDEGERDRHHQLPPERQKQRTREGPNTSTAATASSGGHAAPPAPPPEQPAATFSDDEDSEGEEAVRFLEELQAGFDFSGSASADAAQMVCALCKAPLDVSWDAAREELVVSGGVMVRHTIYHIDCALSRPLLPQQPQPQPPPQQQPVGSRGGVALAQRPR